MGPDGARRPPPGRALRPLEVGAVVVLPVPEAASVDTPRVARPQVTVLKAVPLARPCGAPTARAVGAACLA